jgi:hypothetical protein
MVLPPAPVCANKFQNEGLVSGCWFVPAWMLM